MHINLSRTNRFAFLVTLFLLITGYGFAQSPSKSPQPPQHIASKVDEYMKAAVQVKGFSGSILVARDGQPVISEGYGMANYELDVPNTPATVFRIGSLTKQFTAMAIVLLQESRVLSIDDSVCKYLNECPASWQTITIHNLLTHTSGIPDYSSMPDSVKTMSLPVTHASLIERFKNKPLEFTPGEKFNYSNSGYYLLGVIVERVSGKSYADFLQENIFTPLGMRRTGYDNSRLIIKNRAAGYSMQNGSRVNAEYLDMSIPYAAGALYSTTEDLLRWDQALYTEQLVKRKSLDEIFTPYKERFPGTGYAYGWEITKQFDRQSASHGGSINGFNNYIARYPAGRVTIIVLSNNFRSSTRQIGNDLSAIVFGAPYKIPYERKAVAVTSETLDKYVGQYQLTPNSILNVTNENGRLFAQRSGQQKLELFAETEVNFFFKEIDAQVTFAKDAKARVTGLVLHQGGRNTPAQKIK